MLTKEILYNHQNENAVEEAANILKQGELVAFPTETVYGLGADATNEKAVKKIFDAKGRPSDNPLIVHVADRSQLSPLVKNVPDYVWKLMNRFSPGPITYVLESSGAVSEQVMAGLSTVAIRIPSHPAAQALLQKVNLPIAAPSANLSGKPSPTKAEHVLDDLNGRIAAVLKGGQADVGVESTVLDCTGDAPVILRLGDVTPAQIREIIPVKIAGNQKVNKPKSPGTKYQHYMPQVPLILVTKAQQIQAIINEQKALQKRVGALVTKKTMKNISADKIYLYGDTEKEYAANLYDQLRSIKKDDIDVVIAEKVSTKSVGQAVMDRLTRAATEVR